MKISELAKAANSSKDTIRHYVEQGLLSAHKNPLNGYQQFDESALNQLRFIKMARELGFSLQDIQQVFSDAKNTKSPCPRVRQLLDEKITETRKRIAELNSLCGRMEKAMAAWSKMPDNIPNGSSVCHLIESAGDEKKPVNTKRATPATRASREKI